MSEIEMLYRRSEQFAQIAAEKGVMCATAESCTGGMIATAITEIAGSSAWFDRSFVTYSNEAKQQMLGVSINTLDQFGAVSEQVVAEMALGAIAQSESSISVAVSGVAGPGGGTEHKPVGFVCFAWAEDSAKNRNWSMSKQFDGDRKAVRVQASDFALKGLIALMTNKISEFTRG